MAAGLIEEVSPEDELRRAMSEVGPRFEELLETLGGRLPRCIPGIRELRGKSAEGEERARAAIVESLRGYSLARKAFDETPDRARAVFSTCAPPRSPGSAALPL